MLTDSGPGHSGPRLQVVAKKAAGRFVTISRVAYGTPVQQSAASKVTFGHLHHEVNFAGVNVGDELCTGTEPRRFGEPKPLMSTPIQDMKLLHVIK